MRQLARDTFLAGDKELIDDDSLFLFGLTGQLSKITTELQEVIMSMRMMPLTNTFQKMRRIVFDVSRKLGKDSESPRKVRLHWRPRTRAVRFISALRMTVRD